MASTFHVVCPSCAGVNRLPAARDASAAKCGKCGELLFNGHPGALDGERFDRVVGRTDLPVVVDFWAEWCGPCRMMGPVFEQAAAKLEPNVRFAKVDTERARDIAARYGIRSIPTVILFRGGREVARQSGAMGLADLTRWIERAAA